MTMINKESKVYTIIYIVVLVVVVGSALALTSISLKDKQIENANADKMRQILASVNLNAPADSIAEWYGRYITDTFVVDQAGETLPGVEAFSVNVQQQAQLAADERELPVYVCTLADGVKKYIVPLYGSGLWGPIWGYVSIDADGTTIYGAYFAHQGETPGLGAEIEKPAFSDQFHGRQLFKNGIFRPVAVVKAGQHPAGDEDYVDGISGGTITSRGVGAMIDNCLTPYQNFFKSL